MPKLICFTGKMGAGKSTAITALRDIFKVAPTLVKFAQPLYDIQEAIYERIEPAYQRPAEFVKDRKLLQWLGTDWGRNAIRDSIWVDLWELQVASAFARYCSLVTCDDVRFDNEATKVKALGGTIVRIVSNRTDRQVVGTEHKAHASEAGVSDAYVDHTVVNDGTFEDLKNSLRAVLSETTAVTEKEEG